MFATKNLPSDVQFGACNLLRATFCVQFGACNVACATWRVQLGVCNLACATWRVQPQPAAPDYFQQSSLVYYYSPLAAFLAGYLRVCRLRSTTFVCATAKCNGDGGDGGGGDGWQRAAAKPSARASTRTTISDRVTSAASNL